MGTIRWGQCEGVRKASLSRNYAHLLSLEALWSYVPEPKSQLSLPRAPIPTDQPLRNELPIYEKHPFSQAFCQDLSHVPSSLSEMAVDGHLSRQVVRLVAQIPHTNETTDIDTPDSPGASSIHDLHDILTDLLRLATLKTTKIEHMLCHTLVAYCLSLQSGQILSRVQTPTLRECATVYLQYRSGGRTSERELLLWSAIVIAAAIEMSTDPAVGDAYFLDQALTGYPDANNPSTIVAILQMFLWQDELVPHWQKTWETAMSRRGESFSTSPVQALASSKMSLDSILIKKPDG